MTAPRRYELTDEEWARIRKYFPERKARQRGQPRNDDRQMLNGIQPLCEMAQRGGEGLFQQSLDDLGLNADLQDMSLDSTCVKVHQHSAGAKKGL